MLLNDCFIRLLAFCSSVHWVRNKNWRLFYLYVEMIWIKELIVSSWICIKLLFRLLFHFTLLVRRVRRVYVACPSRVRHVSAACPRWSRAFSLRYYLSCITIIGSRIGMKLKFVFGPLFLMVSISATCSYSCGIVRLTVNITSLQTKLIVYQ